MKRITFLVVVLALVAAACGGSDDDAATTVATTAAPTTTTVPARGDAVNGLALYERSCMACHGPEGAGIEGLGKPWAGSTFINERTDEQMFDFLLVGRPADDPLNTTGIAMLPRGGNQNLTDDDLYDLIAYMRTLNV